MNNNFKLVTLNVGGRTFKTYYDTLKRSTYFQELIQNKKAEQAIAIESDDQQESFFIDRDGDMFEVILHYLRSCDVSVKTPAQLKKLKNEAAFYKFNELEMKADQALYASAFGGKGRNFEVHSSMKNDINKVQVDTSGPLQEKQDPKVLYKYSYLTNRGDISKMIIEK
ncbi:BTB/POZ domain-containing protein [Mucor lusitanicus]|uniref:BTB domain-containing protein n=2 Tax=Mucor circinelloides f. lusitanicus TaxID=29924 RepID=A0A168NUG4_MUCCL|nr:BTB/POZ domain-containing protein [Mucor lusitanicus]OAD06755.1 hypothetical protein MUCCIDRAFT_78217 [Mucor lusitanicus CBS 277.49]